MKFFITTHGIFLPLELLLSPFPLKTCLVFIIFYQRLFLSTSIAIQKDSHGNEFRIIFKVLCDRILRKGEKYSLDTPEWEINRSEK